MYNVWLRLWSQTTSHFLSVLFNSSFWELRAKQRFFCFSMTSYMMLCIYTISSTLYICNASKVDQREKEKRVCGCASTLVSGCMGQHDTTQHHNNDPAQRVSLFSPQIQTQTIWHWPSFNRTTSMLTGRLSYNPIGHAGHRMSLIGWGAHVSVETGGMDQEVDRLHRLRTAPRFVWGLRPCTTLLASNKSWIYSPPTHTHTSDLNNSWIWGLKARSIPHTQQHFR